MEWSEIYPEFERLQERKGLVKLLIRLEKLQKLKSNMKKGIENY